VELLVVSFFLWSVVDPIYTLTADMHIHPGYEEQRGYLLSMGYYNASNGHYEAAQDNDSTASDNLLRIVRRLKEMPEVASFALLNNANYPNALGWSGGEFFNDTVRLHAQQYHFVQLEGSDLLTTLAMRDVRTGKPAATPADLAASKGVVLTTTAARQLFGTTDAVGRTIRFSSNAQASYPVLRVVEAYKSRVNEQPQPLVIRASNQLPTTQRLKWGCNILLRLKEGAAESSFEQRFNREMAPQLAIGNFHVTKLERLSQLRRTYQQTMGIDNTLRLKYALAGFALLCIFLGMTGTFWIRCGARKQDIGLMRSLGATRGAIVRRFLCEAMWLVGIAFLVSLPFTAHRVYVTGFAASEGAYHDPIYWQNQALPHFLTVSLVVYAVTTTIGLLATYIPVRRAVRVLPADALREE
jgi:hypothetical protein